VNVIRHQAIRQHRHQYRDLIGIVLRMIHIVYTAGI
jgi:hypothetical protein